jgi:hypothetical protein
MNLFLAIAVVIAASAAGIALMLLVRRNAPDGGYFNDGDRAAGVFGVLATGFFVFLGFIIFLAFANYDQSRVGAETEALLVAQQFETAQFLPEDVRGDLSDQVTCYGRTVVHTEWPQMEDGDVEGGLNPWGLALFRTLEQTEPETNAEQSAFDKWMDQTSEREQARNDRIHGAEGVIPATLWIVLFFGAAVIFGFMLFFADSGERAVVQGLLIGTVVALVVSSLLLVQRLNSPFSTEIGGIRPVAMERTLDFLAEGREIVGFTGELPCDDNGEPVS